MDRGREGGKVKWADMDSEGWIEGEWGRGNVWMRYKGRVGGRA